MAINSDLLNLSVVHLPSRFPVWHASPDVRAPSCEGSLPISDGGELGGGSDILKFVFHLSSETVELISNTKMKLLGGAVSFILDAPSTGSVWGSVVASYLFIYAIALLVKILSVLLSSPRFPRRKQLTLVILAYLSRVATEAFQVVCLLIGLKPLQAVVSAGLTNVLSTAAHC